MEPNDLVGKLKANGTKDDFYDINLFSKEYKITCNKLNKSDKGAFSLNILCIICRNFDKVPTWCDKVDDKALLTLCIDCLRETRGMNQPEGIKSLACIFHIHRYYVKKNKQVPPELLLKISYMAFEPDTEDLFKEYSKTYCNILLDRLSYIEKLKAKANINKLLPKLNEDIIKIIEIYDTVQFCSSILIFLMRKLNFLYSVTSSERLNGVFKSIFTQLRSKNDLKSFKKLTEKELIELYNNFSHCIYIIVENEIKRNFANSILDLVIRTFVSMIGHAPDLYHCLQTFYLNSFCFILTDKQSDPYVETVLSSMLLAFETTEKMGYNKAMNATYPFLSQLLRLHLEKFSINLSSQAYNNWLKLILWLIRKLRSCTQFLKCDNCKIPTGLHDSLRLAFLSKNLITAALNDESDTTDTLNTYLMVVNEQNISLRELGKSGCVNYANFFKKIQADTHNIAIALNKARYYKHSIKLFDIYLKLEMMNFKTENELKNISRALYNKSICELDFKLYENALLDAFLSLIFARDEGVSTDKYVGLVIDVKSKALKATDENDSSLQLLTVLDACKIASQRETYGKIKPFFVNIKFSAYLKHEFDMYAKMWPSVTPIAGVWNSLMGLTDSEKPEWMMRENNEILRWTLYEVILETPTVVRTIQSDHYKAVVTKLLEDFDRNRMLSSDLEVVYVTLMFLKAEYDLADAGVKHRWKVPEPSIDPDQYQGFRRIPEEYGACRRALDAVDTWTGLVKQLGTITKLSWLSYSLQVSQIYVQQLLRMYCLVQGLQLAHICCLVANHIEDIEVYVRNAGVLLRHLDTRCEKINSVMARAAESWPQLMTDVDTLETAIIFICDVAIFYKRCGSAGTSAKLVQLAQARILNAIDKCPDVKLDLAIGRLLEAQNILCGETGYSILSAVNGTQRHYLAIGNNCLKWSSRRLRALTIKYQITLSSITCVGVARALRLWRRGRGACGVALPAASSPAQAILFALITNVHQTDDAQVKIDNRLKYILGLQQSKETRQYIDKEPEKGVATRFASSQDVETMLENFVFKKTNTSPSLACSVPCFKLPDVFRHSANCDCHCQLPVVYILACQTYSLEASMYFRSNENAIAENYFKGTSRMFDYAEKKLASQSSKTNNYEDYLIEFASRLNSNELRRIRIEFLIEMAFFELSRENFKEADDMIVNIHEITELGPVDQYLMNEVMNLMTASAQVRGIVKRPDLTGLEAEMEGLKLSPMRDILSTPENRGTVPKASKVVGKNEDVMKRLKVIKLNLDDTDEKEVIGPKKSTFKIPVPVTTKPVLEDITPRPIRSIPKIIVTQPSIDLQTPVMTPKVNANDDVFSTPMGSPDRFFTPLTSVKTYTKVKSGVVKKLEEEFISTPKGKENVSAPMRSRSKARLEGLKRATSPGKLEKENAPQIRTRRQRNVNNNANE